MPSTYFTKETIRGAVNMLLERISKLQAEQPLWTDPKQSVPLYRSPSQLLAFAAKLAPFVTRWQLQAANALAYAHFHGWAVPPEEFAEKFGDASEYQIVDVFEKAIHWTDSAAILHPEVDRYDENIVHTTGSGRLSWSIGQDRLELKVSRPAGEAFSAAAWRRYEGAEWKFNIHIEEFRGRTPFHLYHVEALQKALLAVTKAGLLPEKFGEDQALVELWVSALPNPEPVEEPAEEASKRLGDHC